VITTKKIKELEKLAVNRGTPIKELMENAGKRVYSVVKDKYELADKHIVIFAGHGNNGGDGFVAARHLAKECQVIVLFFGWEEKLSDEAKENYEKLKESTINVFGIENKEELGNFHFQDGIELILVDSILGTGVEGKIRDPASLGIDFFNSVKGEKIAVDVPSGMDADTGEVEDKACEVDFIVCFHDVKKGLKQFKENVVVVDIGLPK